MTILCDLNCQKEAKYSFRTIPGEKYMNFCANCTEILNKMGYIHES